MGTEDTDHVDKEGNAVKEPAEIDKLVEEDGKKKRVTFDDILTDLGEFGRYQKRTYLLLFLPTIFSAMQKQSWVFLGAKAAHRCKLPEESHNASFYNPDINLTARIPWNTLDDRLSSCRMYDGQGGEVGCDQGWIFDKTTFGSSAVMEWELVCGDKGLRATAQSVFMVGVMLGSYIFGAMSDKLGRKLSFFVSVVVMAVFGILSGLVPEYWSFIVLRCVVGATTSGVFLVAYVLAMEMVGPRWRVAAGTLCQYYYTLGYLLMAAVAYLLNHDWHLLQVALSLPCVLFLSYWWVVPESVRWQMQEGRYEEAKLQIYKVAAANRVELDQAKVEEMLSNAIADKERSAGAQAASILDLFRHRRLGLRTLNLCFNWMVNSGTYYGLALSASNLGGNPYYNYLISAAVEIPAYAFNLAVLNNPRVGRRLAMSGCMLVAGAVLTLTIFIPRDQVALLVTLSMLGKLAITSSYGTVYIFSAELFPTVVRNVGMGATSMSGRVGGILCPYINMLSDLWTPLPLIIYGGLALTGGLLTLLLPETLGRTLPETIQDGENFGTRGDKEKEEHSTEES